MWIVKDGDDSVCGYFGTEREAREVIMNYILRSDDEYTINGNSYRCIYKDKYQYELVVVQSPSGILFKEPIMYSKKQ